MMTIRLAFLMGMLALLIGASSISIGQPVRLPRLAIARDARGISISDPGHRFSGEFDFRYIDGIKWEVLKSVSYRTATGELATVPAGFITDLCSTPRCFFWAIPPAGDGENVYGIAALFHDNAYASHKIGERAIQRLEADALFLEIADYTKVNWLVGHTVYRMVRWFGWTHW